MYGTPFRAQFASEKAVDEWVETWSSALSGFSADELRQGLEACVTECAQYAPSLGQFMVLCRPKTRPEHTRYLPPPRDTQDRSKQIDELLRKVAATAKPKSHNYAWTLRLNKQTAIDYIWRDPDCVALKAYMVEQGVCDEQGKMTEEQQRRAA